MRVKFLFAFFCLFIISFSLPAQKKKVVVESSSGANVSESKKDVIKATLESGLTESGKFDVLLNVQEYALKIQNEVDAQNSGYIDNSQLFELGKACGADLVIYAKINGGDGQYVITYTLFDIESRKMLPTIKPLIATDQDFYYKAVLAAEKLAGGTFGQEDPPKKEPGIACRILSNQLSLMDDKDQREATWEDAVSACEKKAEGWRLPTQEEMLTICKDAQLFPKQYGSSFHPTSYWTSSKRNGFSVFTVWYPSLSVTYEGTSSSCTYRCVKEIR